MQLSKLSIFAIIALSIPCSAQEPEAPSHRFWDKQNKILFASVVGVRALDYYSTQRFLSEQPSAHLVGNDGTVLYRNPARELMLPNALVRNKPGFAAYSAASAASSIAASRWLHKRGHHRMERLTSVLHIATIGGIAIHNLTLRPSDKIIKYPQP